VPITVTTRVGDKLARLMDEIARIEGMDRSTVIRRFLSRGTREWLIEKNLKEYEQGKITLWQAAKKSELSLFEIIDEVKKRGVHIPYTLEELKKDLKGLSHG